MKKPKPSGINLEETLSRRVRQLRENRNMTVLDLAKNCRFTTKRIDDIESGIEIWLSFADRSILARALGVAPAILKEVEACPSDIESESQASLIDLEALADSVLKGEKNLTCPKCGAVLKTSIENALDFDGHPTQFARAYCPVCPFAIR